MIKFIRLKTNEYNHNDDQILKTRVSYMTKFIKFKKPTNTVVMTIKLIRHE